MICLFGRSELICRPSEVTVSSAELLAWELSKIRVKPVKVGLGIARLSKGFGSSNPGFFCLPNSLLVDEPMLWLVYRWDLALLQRRLIERRSMTASLQPRKLPVVAR